MSKIRPPTHSSLQPSDPALREEAEGGLPDLVRAPDPANRQGAEGSGPPERAINVNFQETGPVPGNGADWPAVPPGATLEPAAEPFTPAQAAYLRSQQNEQNRRGLPVRPSPPEVILARYQRALAEHKAEYAGTRSLAKERPYLEAKQEMIDAGLMKGDV